MILGGKKVIVGKMLLVGINTTKNSSRQESPPERLISRQASLPVRVQEPVVLSGAEYSLDVVLCLGKRDVVDEFVLRQIRFLALPREHAAAARVIRRQREVHAAELPNVVREDLCAEADVDFGILQAFGRERLHSQLARIAAAGARQDR